MSEIHLYNTETQRTEQFSPADPNSVTMYVCGPTVYDTPHLGNARPAVVFDVLFRLFRRHYGAYSVAYARNYTDIDDKIIARAESEGVEIDVLTQRTIAEYEAVMTDLNVLPPTHTPRATDHLARMSSMIEVLEGQGAAYRADGHVLFDTTQTKNRLTRNNDDLLAGARVAPASYKRDQRDFVLWKPSKVGEPSYSGPFDMPGRPGWHIECSAMIHELFKGTIDLHGGGNDLKFPHHECEIHQSEAAYGVPLARHWMHNGMLTVDGRKMSKSADNFITLPEALVEAPGEAIRYLLLSGHYSQPLDFTWAKLKESKTALDRLYRAFRLLDAVEVPEDIEVDSGAPEGAVLAALKDDINTPQALAALHALAERAFDGDRSLELKRAFIEAGKLMGILQVEPIQWFQSVANADEINALIAKRNQHRSDRDYASADAVRQILTEMGVSLEDTSEGTIWHVAS